MKKNKKKTTGTDLNGAGAAVDGWGEPVDRTIAVNQHVDVERNIELTIVTVEGDGKTNMALYLISFLKPLIFHCLPYFFVSLLLFLAAIQNLVTHLFMR